MEIPPGTASPCIEGRKQPGQPLAVTSVAGLLPSRLFFVADCSTGLRFLVDTGAEVSVVPPHIPTVYINRIVLPYKQSTTLQ